MSTSSRYETWFTASEAGEYLRVKAATIHRWVREGRLRVHELATGGGRRFRREDLDAMAVPTSDSAPGADEMAADVR